MSVRADSISVVIPFRGSGTDLRRQVVAVAAQIDPTLDEVIVVLNGESPENETWLRESGPRGVRVAHAMERAGAAYARNVGWSLAKGAIVAFADADDVVQAEWIPRLRQAFVGNPDIDAVIGSQRNVVVGTPPSRPYCSPVVLPDGSLLMCTNNLAVRREVLDQLGGFDESFPFCEDREFTYRFTDAGFTAVYEEEARVDRFIPSRIRDMARKHANYTWWADVANRRHGRRRRTRLPRALVAVFVRLPFLFSRSAMGRSLLGSSIGVIIGEAKVIRGDLSRRWAKIVHRIDEQSTPAGGDPR